MSETAVQRKARLRAMREEADIARRKTGSEECVQPPPHDGWNGRMERSFHTSLLAGYIGTLASFFFYPTLSSTFLPSLLFPFSLSQARSQVSQLLAERRGAPRGPGAHAHHTPPFPFPSLLALFRPRTHFASFPPPWILYRPPSPSSKSNQSSSNLTRHPFHPSPILSLSFLPSSA